MKIGIDARMFGRLTGGVGRYSRELVKNLAAIDTKNHYTVFVPKAEKDDWQTPAKNFEPYFVDFGHYSLAEQISFLKILNSFNFDLVHFTNFNHPIFYKKPYVVTIHDLTMSLFPVGPKQRSLIRRQLYHLVLKNAAKNAEVVMTESATSKKDITTLLKVQSEKIKIIYLGVDNAFKPKDNSEAKDKVLQKYGLKKPYLLFVSQWRPHKGIVNLISAFEIIKEKYFKNDLSLVIPGKPNPDFPEIIAKIKDSKAKNSIILPDFVDEADLPFLYQEAEVFAFPSLYEGFGLNPVEAMATGVAVASSNTSCMPEILGKAALYFDPEDVPEMASKINTLLDNQRLRKKLIRRGFKQAAKYSWQKMAEEILRVYNEAARNKR